SLRVRDLLTLADLKGIRVLAGAGGLDREVINVNVMEAPDIAHWLRGGELLLTSAYLAREDPEKLLNLVQEIQSSNAAAMCIKLGRFITELPSDVRNLADSMNFPILELPMRLAFADVIATILGRIINEQAADIRFSEMVLRSFSQLVAEGGTLDQVLYNLQLFIREDVAFFSLPTQEIHFSAKSADFQTFVAENSLRDVQEKFFCEKVSSGGTVYGYIIVNTPPRRPSDDRQWRTSLEHARTALLLCVQKEMVTREAERRYRDEFVQDLILNNIHYQREIYNRAGHFGWDLKGWVRAIVFDIDDYKKYLESSANAAYSTLEESKKMLFAVIRSTMRRHCPKIPYTTMSDAAVFLDFSPDRQDKSRLKKELAQIQAEIRDRCDLTVTIGVGRFKESCFQCHESYAEAKKAIDIIRPLRGTAQTVFWDELGIFSFLASVCKGQDAQTFCREQLDPLLRFDAEKHGELIQTLNAIIRNNWQMKQAASDLAVHYNTLRYRFDKICELLGSDLSSSEERLNLNVALKIMQIVNSKTF
ncbi:MAG: PucR family transcriptional regulator ligand-binding domain-containing protein, partial [Pyramidobacter sp.]|nr:PucR family transcriptional regulator ligand-binding domain-containing protein [Pyramidobacter sp.]